MKYCFLLLMLYLQNAEAQKLKKADRAIIQSLKNEVAFLSDDKLEGRRTGSTGEKLAYEYLAGQFSQIGLLPRGDSNTFLQAFAINEGKEISPSSHFIINGEELAPYKDFFPFLFGAQGTLEAFAVAAFKERGSPWFLDIKEIIESSANNPHFDIDGAIRQQAEAFEKKGASAVFVFHSDPQTEEMEYHPFSNHPVLNIPVVFIKQNAVKKFLHDPSANLEINLKIETADKIKTGHNVIGYIDNGAPYTIIAGAHFDHLGYGEDHNSLWTGERAIHNGADDNASGTSLILELAKLIKKSKLRNNNYLFVCFSGEELGLIGSKYFTNHPPVNLQQVNYMINADMVGRLNEPSHQLNIGGYGTSPAWGKILENEHKYFQLNFDSSGVGPSDHTSFYLKDIPVLFFFTGSHSDYHKPGDDAEKINYIGQLQVIKYIYQLIDETNNMGKLPFTKTKEPSIDSPQFTVGLGVMPDYSYQGEGVRADAVIDGKPAQKAGLLSGDIIIKIDDHSFHDLTSYMKVLGLYKKGDAVKVGILRGDNPMTFDLVF